jgi:putative membrane protein
MIKNISTENRLIGLLLLFYFFGLLGIALPEYRNLFLPLSPLNLILTLVIFYKVNNDFSPRFCLLSSLIFLIGFSVEAVGVATGALFGSYAYGDIFGFKIFDTPALIGVNWLFLALSTYGIVQYFTKKSLWLILLPPLLMTALDYFVEPVAIALGFWHWENNVIPLQNYMMWFVTSLVIHGLIHLFRPTINAKISFVVFSVQLVFFGVLNIVLT